MDEETYQYSTIKNTTREWQELTQKICFRNEITISNKDYIQNKQTKTIFKANICEALSNKHLCHL